METIKITANNIISLLKKRHIDDVFVPECKNGSSYNGHFRLDAWAMKKSWSKPATIGYEVKVSRSDFLRDDKWHEYLNYCTLFYFVCPSGLIKPEELPAGIGLIWVSKTGTRLFTKRNAAHREVDIPEDIFRYILMARAVISNNIFYRQESNKDYWSKWLEDKAENQLLGRSVSNKLNKLVREKIHEVDSENKSLKVKIALYEKIEARIRELGFDPEKRISEWNINQKLDELKRSIPLDVKNNLSSLLKGIEKLNELIKDEE